MSPWGSALECDMLLLQDMTASGQWTGLPQLCWATKKRTCVQYLDPATVNPDLVPQRRFILVGQTPVHAVAVHSWSEQTLHCTGNFPMQGDGQRSIEGLSFPCGRVMGIQIRLHVLLPLVAILAALSPVLASHPWQSVLLALLVAGPLLVITAPYPGSLARNCHFMPFQTNGSCFSCPESFLSGRKATEKEWSVLSSVPDPCPLNGQCCLGLDPRIGPRHRSETLWLHNGSHPAMALGGPCLYWRPWCEAQGHLRGQKKHFNIL